MSVIAGYRDFCYLRIHGHGPTPFGQSKGASLNEEGIDVIFSLFLI